MTLIDNRGGRVDYNIIPSSGWTEDYAFQDSNGDPVDISDRTFSLTLSDDGGNSSSNTPSSPTTKSATVISAAGGTFKFHIPAADFGALWGEQITYSITSTVTGEDPEPFVWGVFICQELI